MTMFSTFIFWLIIFCIASFIVVPMGLFLLGFFQGLQNRGNGFDDFVNSNRWSDNK